MLMDAPNCWFTQMQSGAVSNELFSICNVGGCTICVAYTFCNMCSVLFIFKCSSGGEGQDNSHLQAHFILEWKRTYWSCCFCAFACRPREKDNTVSSSFMFMHSWPYTLLKTESRMLFICQPGRGRPKYAHKVTTAKRMLPRCWGGLSALRISPSEMIQQEPLS